VQRTFASFEGLASASNANSALIALRRILFTFANMEGGLAVSLEAVRGARWIRRRQAS
jgi:hypothetical protein